MRRSAMLCALLAVTVAASAGSAGVPDMAEAAPVPIRASIKGFAPKVVKVKRGAVVRWRNSDGRPHNAVSLKAVRGRSLFTSGALTPRNFRARAPRRPGRYPYICTEHSLTMRGVLVVR